MLRSERRVLTTHAGSLPRSPELRDLLVRQERGEPIDKAELARQVEAAAQRAVAGQRRSTTTSETTAGSRASASRPTWLRRCEAYGEIIAFRRRFTAKIMNAPQAWRPWSMPISARPCANVTRSGGRRRPPRVASPSSSRVEGTLYKGNRHPARVQNGRSVRFSEKPRR